MRIAGLILALVALFPMVSNGAEASKSFTGRVIYCDTSSVEVKRGPKEMRFIVSESTKITSGKEAKTVNDLAICQKVVVKYASRKEGDAAVEIDIVRESDCRP